MEQKTFSLLLPKICTDLTYMIMEKENLSQTDAIIKLYNSKLYALLEQEETKLWYYSTPMLYSLLEQESISGNIRFPDV